MKTRYWRFPTLRRWLLFVFAVPLGLVAADLYSRYASYRPDWLMGLILIAPMTIAADYAFYNRTSGNIERDFSSTQKERPLGL